jgi:DNA-binding protein YbaB
MDDRVLTPDDARQRLDAWKGKIDKLATDTKAMSDQFQQLQVTKKDPNGLAEVTVDSTGSLIGLRLTREIERSSPDVVATTIMTTIRAAKADLAARTQEIIAETVGADSAAGRAIAERVGQQLLADQADQTDDGYGRYDDYEPDVVEPAPQKPTPKRAATVRDDDGEDDNDLNLWR